MVDAEKLAKEEIVNLFGKELDEKFIKNLRTEHSFFLMGLNWIILMITEKGYLNTARINNICAGQAWREFMDPKDQLASLNRYLHWLATQQTLPLNMIEQRHAEDICDRLGSISFLFVWVAPYCNTEYWAYLFMHFVIICAWIAPLPKSLIYYNVSRDEISFLQSEISSFKCTC